MKKIYLLLSVIIMMCMLASCGKNNSLKNLPKGVSCRTIETFYTADSSYNASENVETIIIKDYDSQNRLIGFVEIEDSKDTLLCYNVEDGHVANVRYKGSAFEKADEYTWTDNTMNIHFNDGNLVMEIENYDFAEECAFSLLFDYDEHNFYTITSSETGCDENIEVSSNIHNAQYKEDSLQVFQNIMRIRNTVDIDGIPVGKSTASYSKNVIEYIRKK